MVSRAARVAPPKNIYTPLQYHSLTRLEHLYRLQIKGGYDDFQTNLLHRALFTTLRECAEAGLGTETLESYLKTGNTGTNTEEVENLIENYRGILTIRKSAASKN